MKNPLEYLKLTRLNMMILIVLLVLLGFVMYNRMERFQSEPAPAEKPEETKHFRETSMNYRENDKRSDIVDLKDKMSEFLFDGLDNWPRVDGTGWWGDVIQNKNNPGIYARKVWIWPD